MIRRLFCLLVVMGVCDLVQGQIKLTAKAGVEFAFIEIESLSINYSNFGYHSAVYGPGLGRFTVLQMGGTFGGDQLNEAGFGLAFGSYNFLDLSSVPAPKVTRKSIYINHWGEGSGAFDFGIGSQVYWYNLEIESVGEDPVFYDSDIDISSSWRSLGLDWRVMLRRNFGEYNSHNITLHMGLTGERIKFLEASTEDRNIEFTNDESELALGWRFGFTYTYVFGRNED